MAVIVAGENSYVTETELAAYAGDRGIVIAGDPSVLLIKAMDWLSIQAWSGSKTDELQPLDFPRNGDTTVPVAIKNAQIYLALRADSGVDLLAAAAIEVKRKKIDVIETEYATGSNVLYKPQDMPYLKSSLAPYLAADYGPLTFRVVRG